MTSGLIVTLDAGALPSRSFHETIAGASLPGSSGTSSAAPRAAAVPMRSAVRMGTTARRCADAPTGVRPPVWWMPCAATNAAAHTTIAAALRMRQASVPSAATNASTLRAGTNASPIDLARSASASAANAAIQMTAPPTSRNPAVAGVGASTMPKASHAAATSSAACRAVSAVGSKPSHSVSAYSASPSTTISITADAVAAAHSGQRCRRVTAADACPPTASTSHSGA